MFKMATVVLFATSKAEPHTQEVKWIKKETILNLNDFWPNPSTTLKPFQKVMKNF